MSLRTELLPVVESARTLTGITDLDQRTQKLTIRTRRWSGGKIDSGAHRDTDLVIPQHYTIKQATARQVEQLLGSGGSYTPGQHVILWVTPAWYAVDGVTKLGGYTPDEVAPKGTEGTEVLYLISGALNGEYAKQGVLLTRPYRYELLLTRRNATP